MTTPVKTVGDDDVPMAIKFSRTGDVTKELSVNLAPAFNFLTSMEMSYAMRGSAVAGRDYVAIPDTMKFTAGQETAELQINTSRRLATAPDRSIRFELAPSIAYDVEGTPVDITITARDSSLPGAGTGLAATYYSDLEFKSPVLTRIEPTIDFSWGKSVPDDKIDPKKGWSARWEGQLQPPVTGVYRLKFNISTYAALNVWLDGKKVIAVKNIRHTLTISIGQGRSRSDFGELTTGLDGKSQNQDQIRCGQFLRPISFDGLVKLPTVRTGHTVHAATQRQQRS